MGVSIKSMESNRAKVTVEFKVRGPIDVDVADKLSEEINKLLHRYKLRIEKKGGTLTVTRKGRT